jgi:hypothetical protein
MAINYGTLGLNLTPPPTYGTVQTTTGGPSPSNMPLYPIGTGKAAATGAVGTTTDKGSDIDNYKGSLEATEISRISSMPSDPSIRPEATSLKEKISNYLADIMNPSVAFNAVTGTYRNTSFGAASAAAGPFGAVVDTLGGIFGGIAKEQTLNIARKAYDKVPGYGVASFNGMTIGVSPGIMGTHNIVGNLPNLDFKQTQQLAQNVLGLSNLSGAYSPTTDPTNYPKGYDFSILSGQPVGYGYNPNDPMARYAPSAPTGMGATGIFQNYSGQDVEDSYSHEPGSFKTYTTSSGATGWDSYGSGVVRTTGGAPVTSGGGAVRTGAWTGGTSGTIGGGSSNDSPGDDSRDNSGSGGADAGGFGTGAGEQGGLSHAKGGRVGLAPGGRADNVTEGFVNKDPKSVSDAQSIADNRYTSVKAGSFVVNQPANEKNKKKLDKIVADASKTAKMKKGGKAGMVDVALSDGERLIEPEVVAAIEKKHGKNFLDKLNDAGKPEVKRRQAKYGEKIGAAQGSFITDQGMELGDVGDDVDMQDYVPVSDELKAKLSKFAAKKPQRGQIKSFIKSLSPEDKLTVLFLTETQSTTDPVESMEAIGEVVKNRIGSNYYDFKDIKTLDDALLKQTRKGAFHFSGLEPSTLYARAKEVKKGLADKGLAKAYAAAQNTLDPETEGASRLPANTVFYTRKDAPSQWMRESKDLEFSTELGGHEFYRTFAAPEFP